MYHRQSLPLRLVVPAAALLALAAACSSGGPTGSLPGGTSAPGGSLRPSLPPESAAPDTLLLRIAADGGFVPPGVLVTRLPQVTVYADGRVIEPGVVPAIYPGPAVSPLMLHQLGRDGIDGITAAARGAGLAGPDRSYTSAQVADVETTVVTFIDADGPHRLSIYALGFRPDQGASAEEKAARTAIANLVRQVQAYVGATSTTTYAPTALRIYATRATSPASGEPAPNVVDWPAALPALASLAPANLPPRASCGVIQGPLVVAFTAVMGQATQITRYRQAGVEWTLAVRPLLPDEARACG